MEQAFLIGLAMVGLVALNIAAFKYVGVFGFFVTAASIPFANKLLDIIEKL